MLRPMVAMVLLFLANQQPASADVANMLDNELVFFNQAENSNDQPGGFLESLPGLDALSGLDRHRSGDRCNATNKCPANHVCKTTRRGNMCVYKNWLPCSAKGDCVKANCLKMNGASLGQCNLCSNTTDCQGNKKCLIWKHRGLESIMAMFSKYGWCVNCTQDSDCKDTEYCVGARSSGSDQDEIEEEILPAISGIFEDITAHRRPMWFSCQAKRTSGERCRRSGQCKSGECKGFWRWKKCT